MCIVAYEEVGVSLQKYTLAFVRDNRIRGRPRARSHFGIEQPVALVFSYKANVTDSNET